MLLCLKCSVFVNRCSVIGVECWVLSDERSKAKGKSQKSKDEKVIEWMSEWVNEWMSEWVKNTFRIWKCKQFDKFICDLHVALFELFGFLCLFFKMLLVRNLDHVVPNIHPTRTSPKGRFRSQKTWKRQEIRGWAIFYWCLKFSNYRWSVRSKILL